jgi:hypothetical protein
VPYLSKIVCKKCVNAAREEYVSSRGEPRIRRFDAHLGWLWNQQSEIDCPAAIAGYEGDERVSICCIPEHCPHKFEHLVAHSLERKEEPNVANHVSEA